MLEKFLQWSTGSFKRPVLVLVITAILIGICAIGLPMVRFDNNVRNMIPQDNHDLKVNDYYTSDAVFGNDTVIFLGFESANAYDMANLRYLKAIQDGIEALSPKMPAINLAKLFEIDTVTAQKLVDFLLQAGINETTIDSDMMPILTDAAKLTGPVGLDAAAAAKIVAKAKSTPSKDIFGNYRPPVKKTQSLLNADYIASEKKDGEEELVVQQLLKDGELTPEAVASLQTRVESWPIYKDGLISGDRTLASLLVTLQTENSKARANLNLAIEDLLKSNANPNIKSYMDGEPVLNDLIARYMADDMKLLMPLVVVVVVVILFLCFRRIGGVIFPMLIVGLACASSVGLMGLFGIPLTVVSTTLPVLLTAIVSAYGIHQMNHYYLEPELDKRTVFTHNMKNVGLAITLSGITVMIGFGALVTEDFIPIKNFGIFTAIGDMIGVVAALFVIPAFILLSKKPKKVVVHESTKGWIGGILKGFRALNHKASPVVVIVSVVIFVVFTVGGIFIKTEFDNISMFRPGETIRAADDKLNEKLAGTQSLSVIFDSDLSDLGKRINGEVAASGEIVEIITPEILGKIDQFSQDVQKQFPFVSKVMSFNDVIKKMNREMNGGAQEFYRIPESKELISQYLLLFSGDIKGLVTNNHDKLRVNISMKRVGTTDTERLAEYTRQYFNAEFQKTHHVQVAVTGVSHLYWVTNNLLVEGFLRSIVVCMIIVFALLLYILRSFIMSLIAMTPIFVTLAINAGMLGLFNIPLNVGTAMVSSIAIGIGVDYSIHFITWYRHELRKRPDVQWAIDESIMHKGRAILYNMFVIFGGFGVLVFSRFVPLMQFGAMVSLCMVTTAVGALVIVPAILRLLAKKNPKFLYLGVPR